MITFSHNPRQADEQVRAILFYLITFGYIDGEFDHLEKQFIRNYINELAEWRCNAAGIQGSGTWEQNLNQQIAQYNAVFDQQDRYVQELFTESVAHGENQHQFVYARLKLRCFEIFHSFDADSQRALLEAVDEVIAADGVIHPAEAQFRDELFQLLQTEVPLSESDYSATPQADIEVATPSAAPSGPAPGAAPAEDFFHRFERHYASDPQVRHQQAMADNELLNKAMRTWSDQRGDGLGRAIGKRTVDELNGQPPFLDGHVYGVAPQPGQAYELLVLGDLHGCYSCLKAALKQSYFLEKIEAYRNNHNLPYPMLVTLGDYIDRGRFSFHGVLRTILELFTAYPEHVFTLRGNHEFYLERQGRIMSGVLPAEAINTLVDHMPMTHFVAYKELFEKMPTSMVFGRTLFVHAGIPKDETLRRDWRGIDSLNTDAVRFEMMWSDPSEADYIPDELQGQNARFPFGRLQFRQFMSTIGANLLVRGHEKVTGGVEQTYADPDISLITLFSAGGTTNNDLPPRSGYRAVTPMALTIQYKDYHQVVTPWQIDYASYQDPEKNAFYAYPPELDQH